MTVDMGQALMLALAVPAMCLLLFTLTRVEEWLLHDDDPYLRGKSRTGAGDGGPAQSMPEMPGAVDAAPANQAAPRDDAAADTALPGGRNEAA